MPEQHQPNNLSNTEAALAVGSVIGDTYKVLDFIGQGGMGFVYKVEHLMMAKVMALKILRSEQVTGDVWKRFQTEAQAIARLDHVNVVRIYDMSQTRDGKPFYTMDLLVGESLADYLERCGRMPVTEALPVFRQICAGLAYAHDRGIVHRDIKPANIMLVAEKNAEVPVLVKIVDFGIAKLSALDGSAGQNLTRPGEVFGSPLYMSPEQCSGLALDYRTDMYSVGVTMFQALTGHPPLVGKNAIETASMHQSVLPLLVSEDLGNIEIPVLLDEIVARLLEKSPDQRYDSLADVSHDLLELERGAISDFHTRRPTGLNYDSDTASRTTILPLNSNNGRYFLIFALIILALGLAGSYLWNVLSGRGQGQTVSSKPASEGAAVTSLLIDAIGKDPTNHEPLNQDELSDTQRKQIEKFLQTRKAPYAHIENRQGQLFKVFDFPADFSLGFYAINPQLGHAAPGGQARGQIRIPLRAVFKLEIGDSVKAYPELLRYLNANDVNWLTVGPMKALTPALKSNLSRLSIIQVLDLTACPAENKDLPWIDQFAMVRSLIISATLITAPALAKSACLPRLYALELENVTDILPVLKVLVSAGVIRELDVARTGSGSAEVDQIAKMHKLIRLSLRRDEITDADVAKLSSLSRLIDLDIQTNRKLTPRIVEILKKYKQLEVLTIPYDLLDDNQDRELMKALPHLHTSESKNGI